MGLFAGDLTRRPCHAELPSTFSAGRGGHAKIPLSSLRRAVRADPLSTHFAVFGRGGKHVKTWPKTQTDPPLPLHFKLVSVCVRVFTRSLLFGSFC